MRDHGVMSGWRIRLDGVRFIGTGEAGPPASAEAGQIS